MADTRRMAMNGHTLVFLGGLHRSGTTPLARTLAAHPNVSGFHGTGAKMDEGQFLQTVYPPARTFGGPGRFALATDAHLTESSPLATDASAQLLLEQWSKYWDMTRQVLVEKSPPNLIKTRFLQALFPDARFVIIVRHPVVTTLASRKWRSQDSFGITMSNWFAAHRIVAADAPHLRDLHIVRYEDLMRDPESSLTNLGRFVGVGSQLPRDGLTDHGVAYRDQWRARRLLHRRLISRYEEQARAWGYDMTDLDWLGPNVAIPPRGLYR